MMGEGECIINQLPDDILLSILLVLDNMREAVRARALSRRWRHLFPAMTDLNFDVSSVLGIKSERYSIRDAHKLKFVKGVDQILQQLYCSGSRKKIRSVNVMFNARDDIACYIDTWIDLVVGMAVEKIQLNFSVDGCEGTSLDGGHYSFPCHLLSRGQLKHLSLHSCFLRPSLDVSRDRFRSLETLVLFDTRLSDTDIDNILSGCVNIVWLRLQYCSLPQTLSISGKLPRLKKLFMKRCTDVQNFVLKSANLQILEYVGEKLNFTFSDVLKLEKVIFLLVPTHAINTEYMLSFFAKDLPQLSHLKLLLVAYQPTPAVRIPSGLTKFSCLKELELDILVSHKFDLLTVTFLINASPILQKFHLGLNIIHVQHGRSSNRQWAEQPHFQLKEVEISGFRDRWNEMELARYLLKNAVQLECMVINTQRRSYRSCDTWIYTPYSVMNIDLERKRIYDLLSNEEKGNPGAKLVVV